MGDSSYANTKDVCNVPASLAQVYGERPEKFAANGHEEAGEAPAAPPPDPVPAPEDPFRKRINPLKIHLGKRPYVDNSMQQNYSNKKKLNQPRRPSAPPTSMPVAMPVPVPHRVPKLIPKKKIDKPHFHNVSSHPPSILLDNEDDKPVPRLVPKSQLHQFKKGIAQKGAFKEYPQNLGLQPTVKFKCRKCYSMSFKTLAMLKDHQRVCRTLTKEPVLSPEAASAADSSASGPSRVTRKVYLCSACGTYYENWNLFLHMREVHNRHICLFCLGMFSKAEKLSAHLVNKHNVQEHSYESKEEFCNIYNGTLYLMCCDCDAICSEQDDFFNHDCNKVIPKPVPVLVSKNHAKINNMRQGVNTDPAANGPSTYKERQTSCDTPKSDFKDINEFKHDQIPPKIDNVSSSSDMRQASHGSTEINDTNYSCNSAELSKVHNLSDNSGKTSIGAPTSYTKSLEPLPNGEEGIDHRESNASPIPMDVDPPAERTPLLWERPATLPPVEKECGIKLKLSLNNLKSPVIINSTVDPTIGQKSTKPPLRARRPPKRYEKDSKSHSEPTTPRNPSIKMTICDKADSPFVKTTIYENNQETTLKKLLNNNLESPKSHSRAENIMSTIYDNKLDDLNAMNRVPKLTVRVPKELLDKDSSSDYSSDSEQSDKLTVDENTNLADDSEVPSAAEALPPEVETTTDTLPTNEELTQEPQETATESILPESNQMDVAINTTKEAKSDYLESDNIDIEKISDEPPADEIPVIELNFDRPLDRYPLKELLKIFLSTTIYNCIYCNHARKIAVNCKQLSLHMATEHRFSATVDSITAEELMPETITAKVKNDAETMNSVFINQDTYDSEEKSESVQYDHIFECFQCYFKTSIHKDLYLHNRKMHQKTILLCVMCKSNFYSYSELLCHLCPGTYNSEYEIKFRCHLCNVDSIPSSFRLMVHLRKTHNSCDVCLEFCHNQARLSNHVWKHKLHHLCYRCGIAYRNKLDITNHLFWKHGTESVLCKRCMQKKWPHVYHFCSPPAIFVCDECSLQFTKAVYLKVHKRFHANEFPHPCIEEGCTEKFVSKKLLMKHLEEHQRKLASEDLDAKQDNKALAENAEGSSKNPIPVIDLANDDDKPVEAKPEVAEKKPEDAEPKKLKKKKQKEKDALLLSVNLPELNLSESDSSDESDSGTPTVSKSEPGAEPSAAKEEPLEKKAEADLKPDQQLDVEPVGGGKAVKADVDMTPIKEDENVKEEKKPTLPEHVKPDIIEEEKPDEKQVLEIWDNFQKFQAKTEKFRKKTPPLVPIRKHVCESDHDYCLVPNDLNGDDQFGSEKKKKKRDRLGFSSSSSSSSDSDSSCSCGSNCSCSSSSGSSSSSSSDSDSSDEPSSQMANKPKKIRKRGRPLTKRRLSNGSNVDVMGMSDTPVLVPDKTEPLIPETDLDTNESDTDEDFYDEHPQKLANKMYAEKRNQLMLLASVAPSDGGTASAEPSRPVTPVDQKAISLDKKEKTPGSKKKSKKKKRSKSSKKHGPIKLNIPKDIISSQLMEEVLPMPLAPNKITISLQNNTVQIPTAPIPAMQNFSASSMSTDNKRASKRRRVPNKFYGYSSDEEGQQAPVALKPQLPPKLEWRKEDLPSPVTTKAKKKEEVPSFTITQKLFSYSAPHRLSAPAPGPEPPRALMNTESMESSDDDSSDSGALEIASPRGSGSSAPPPPTYLNSGTSSLPYAFQRPAGRQAREGESVYCYCRCPYDEVSEMIACDADGCSIEWFHFECVGIMVPPKGKWYCPECRKKQTYSA